MEENKYKAALERAKSAIKECGGNVGRIKMIESIFSDELWESEEEQTRKQLLDFVQRNTLASYSDRDKWVAYLEKMKDFDKKLEQAYKANNDEIFNYGYKAAKAELGEQDDEDPRWKYAYDLIIAEEMYQMSMNDEMVEEARTKAYEALCKIGHIGDLLHLENLKDFDKQLEEAYKTADEVQYKRGYGKGYVDGMADAKKKELEKQGEFPTTISVDKMVEEFERARIEANSICQIIETDAYRKGVVDTLSKILIKEEKPITIGSKKAEGKLGEMIAASKEPAESGEEDKQLTHKEVTKKSDKVWSEEDEIGFGDTLWAINKARTISENENDMGNLWYAENWLKNIKGRLQ